MAVTNLSLPQVGSQLFQDTDNENASIVVKASSGTFYVVYVDNSANAGAASYVKLYNSNGSVTVGTTVPDWVLMAPGAFVGDIMVVTGGVAFSTGLQVSTVTTGGTAGTTSPSSAVVVRIVYA